MAVREFSRRDLGLMHRAARLYYLDELNQAAIAERLSVSRPTVSRLLSEARRIGLVRITVHDHGLHPAGDLFRHGLPPLVCAMRATACRRTRLCAGREHMSTHPFSDAHMFSMLAGVYSRPHRKGGRRWRCASSRGATSG